MQEMVQKITTKAVQIIASKYFFWGVVAIFILQALWIALSFKYPLLYDEYFHFPVIQIFTHHFSPVIFDQPDSYNKYGSFLFGDAGLFHYLMSFPLRVISLFTDNYDTQVVSLRVINIIIASSSLFIFARLLKEIGAKAVFINISLLLFSLIPIVPFITATINYDNMLMPIVAWFLLICVRILKDQDVKWSRVVMLLTIGCLGSLIKYSFLPIFAVAVVYLSIVLIRRHGIHIWSQLISSGKEANRLVLTISVLVVFAALGLFSFKYIQPLVRYGSPNPDCSKVMDESKCFHYVDRRNKVARETKDQREITPLPQYAIKWYSENLSVTNRTAAVLFNENREDNQTALPIMNMLFFIAPFIGIAVLLYAWRSLRKNSSWHFLLVVSTAYLISVFITNYLIYLEYHQAFAIQPRYLLPFVPIIIAMILIAASFVLRKHRYLKLVLLSIVLIMFTQGGGVTTHILRSSDSWYWENSKVLRANHAAKKILSPLIKEN